MIKVESYIIKETGAINEFERLMFGVCKCVEVKTNEAQPMRGYITSIKENIVILENNGQSISIEIDKIIDIKIINPDLLRKV